ncbi:non-specific lipid-transfer protein 1-like [Actinidia eriantha]|uniref:non-specific lipid-transfer protein 1-like n=1 Tax=Actinidia eriantha TaxID=165200 RepID=UPI002590FACE|nr:non-specific lipid-transfer protein 1-like [Actinidia eriantha]
MKLVLAPCVPYLTRGGNPVPKCCDGEYPRIFPIFNIKGMASSTVDKRATCNYVKVVAIHYPSLKDNAVQALPTKCGVEMDIPDSQTTNCDV